MPLSTKLHVYEEATNLFWGLIVVAATGAATYILGNSFISVGWQISGFKQVIVLLLFTLSFIGIFKISDPLLHFVIFIEHATLHVEVHKGEDRIKTIEIALSNIEALKFDPHFSRSKGEAMFDFSTSYHLMWKSATDHSYHKLIDLESISFTLKVEDIAKIIRLVREHDPNIEVPTEQQGFL